MMFKKGEHGKQCSTIVKESLAMVKNSEGCLKIVKHGWDNTPRWVNFKIYLMFLLCFSMNVLLSYF